MSEFKTAPSFYAAILFQSRLNPHAVAVVTESGEISYASFCRDVERVTRRLCRLAIPVKGRVGVQADSAYLRWLAIIALARLGIVSVSLADWRVDLESLGMEAVLTDNPAPIPFKRTVEIGAEWLDPDADALPAWADVRHPIDAPCRLVLSSGTTGVPKKSLLTYGQIRARMRGNVRAYGLNGSARIMTTMGTATIGGFMMLISCWSTGGAVLLPVTMGRPRRELLKLHPNVLMLPPAQLVPLLNSLPQDHWPREHMSIYVAGSALSPNIGRATRLRLSDRLFVIYGSTEAGSVTMAHASVADYRPGFTGFVLPTAEVQVVDEGGTPLGPDEVGEVRIRAEGMVDGYADEEDTDESAFRDGWFYPGDLGMLSGDGGLSIVGRTREVMNFGGAKFAPERIEQALGSCPGIVEMAVFSIPDAAGNQRPCVAIVPGAGFDEQALAQEFKKAFPALPALATVRVDALPRNEMGKVLRTQLAQQVLQAVQPSRATPPRLRLLQ